MLDRRMVFVKVITLLVIRVNMHLFILFISPKDSSA